MLAGKLQAAAQSGLRRHVEHGRVLPDLATRIAAERVGIAGPEPRDHGVRVEALGYLRRHLGKISAKCIERRLRVVDAGYDAEIIGDDSRLARLIAARFPEILKRRSE